MSGGHVMSAHPPAEDAVSELRELFPDKSIEILTSQVEMAQLPDVVGQLRSRRGGGIVLLFTRVPEVEMLHRMRLSRMPPRTADQDSNEPRCSLHDGEPSASHPRARVASAAASRGRLARVQPCRSAWRKPSRNQGHSTSASRRTRTVRRVTSRDSTGLLAVAIHSARLGTRTIRDCPRMRSVHTSQVNTAAILGLSRAWPRLSSSTI